MEVVYPCPYCGCCAEWNGVGISYRSKYLLVKCIHCEKEYVIPFRIEAPKVLEKM